MPSNADQLHRLWEMFKEGALTREEYEEEKAHLRNSSGSPSSGGPPSRPESIGMYQLGDFVGKGGMGVVWKARHELASNTAAQGDDVALKHITGPQAQSDEYRRRFPGPVGEGGVPPR